MASKRGNPVESVGKSKVLSQHVVHPVADDSNTSGGNPAKMRVPVGKKTVISQQVMNPSASNKGGGK
jgi:hypothetical protein